MINSLTSLRFFFAFFVFISHLGILETDPKYLFLYQKIFYEGFLGVSFFFILSGFILSYAYKSRLFFSFNSIKQFYIARLARIYPIHIITLLVALMIGLYTGKNDLFIIPNIFLVQSFFSSSDIYFSLNAPSWSISDEMFFYFLFPLLLFIQFRFKLLIFFVLALTIVLLNLNLSNKLQHYWLYISPIIRLADFLLGILLYHLVFDKNYRFIYKVRSNFLEISAIVIFIVHDYLPISFRYSLYYWIPMSCIIYVFAMTASANKLGILSLILSNRYLIFLGEISFCFYLCHMLVMQVMFFLKKTLAINVDILIFSIAIFFITICVSILLHKYIEVPLNKKIKEMFV